MSRPVSRSTLLALVKRFQADGVVPVEEIVELLRARAPEQLESPSGLYHVRLYDGFDHCWTDVSDPIPWEAALEVWRERTNNGLEKTCYDDIDYYSIFPSDTRMVFSER